MILKNMKNLLMVHGGDNVYVLDGIFSIDVLHPINLSGFYTIDKKMFNATTLDCTMYNTYEEAKSAINRICDNLHNKYKFVSEYDEINKSVYDNVKIKEI